ncbi:MAG TPA: DnaA/Hda family protein [Pirellulaceae bacterium]|nr:DnaA/Hda family protein [Pirellulaceae bacterium]
MSGRVVSLPLSTRILPPDATLFKPAPTRITEAGEAPSRRRSARETRAKRQQDLDELVRRQTTPESPDLEASWKSLLHQADRPFPIDNFLIGQENVLLLPAIGALLREPRWSVDDSDSEAAKEPFDRQAFGDRLPEDLRELLYNPLVFFGPSGVGKSHLTWGLAARWAEENPRRRPIVVAAVDFARSYATAIETDSLPDFRQNFQGAGLLLVEDLQQIESKRPAQLELRRLIDDVLTDGAAVLVTMRRSPIELTGLDPGLASRLMQGLTAPMQPPGEAVRRRMIERVATLHRLPFGPDALALLSQRLEGTLPELNHALLQFAARGDGVARMLAGDKSDRDGSGERDDASDLPHALDESHVAEFLEERDKSLQPSLKTIAQAVSKYFKLRIADLKGKTRRQNVVHARAIAMFLSRELTDESLERVGKHYGGRDHTTVIHACRKTAGDLETDAETKRAIHELRLQLRPLNGAAS